MAHADYSVTGGKLVYLQEENPAVGEEKPYEPPQSDEKPRFAIFARSSSPAGLQHVLLLRCFELLGNHCFLLQLIQS